MRDSAVSMLSCIKVSEKVRLGEEGGNDDDDGGGGGGLKKMLLIPFLGILEIGEGINMNVFLFVFVV